MGASPGAEKLKAIGASIVALGVIVLGVGFAVMSRTPAAARPSLAPATPEATLRPFAFEGLWFLDFEASGLVRPTLGPTGPGIGSSLELIRGMAHYGSGYGGGCDLRAGTYRTDGVALVIHLGANSSGGCKEAAVDEIASRLGLVATISLEPCQAGYRYPSGGPAASDGSCRQIWLRDSADKVLLVYTSSE